MISDFQRAHLSNHFALLLLHNKLTDDRVVVTNDAVLSADFIEGDGYHICHCFMLFIGVSSGVPSATLNQHKLILLVHSRRWHLPLCLVSR